MPVPHSRGYPGHFKVLRAVFRAVRPLPPPLLVHVCLHTVDCAPYAAQAIGRGNVRQACGILGVMIKGARLEPLFVLDVRFRPFPYPHLSCVYIVGGSGGSHRSGGA